MTIDLLTMTDAVDDRLAAPSAICSLAAVSQHTELPEHALAEALEYARRLIEEARTLVTDYQEAQQAAA